MATVFILTLFKQKLLWSYYLCPSNSYAEALTLAMAIIRDWAYKEAVKVKYGHKGRTLSIGLTVLGRDTKAPNCSF